MKSLQLRRVTSDPHRSTSRNMLNWCSGAALALGLLLSGALCASAQTTSAYGWDQSPLSTPGSATAVVCDSTGAVYACGQVRDSSGLRAAVLKSEDRGATWTPSQIDAPEIPGVRFAYFRHITAASVQGNAPEQLFAVGASVVVPPAIPSGQYLYAWEIYRSIDLGQSWQPITEPIILSGFYDQNALQIAADTAGNVYVVGNARKRIVQKSKTTEEAHGIILKGTRITGSDPSLDTYDWNTISDTVGVSVNAVHCVGSTVFVAKGGNVGWQLQKSTNGGASWTTIDQVSGGNATDLTADSAGDLIVIGGLPRKGGLGRAVRKGTQNGSFKTVYLGESGIGAGSVAVDRAGYVHVTGMISGLGYWITLQGKEVNGAWSGVQADGPFGTATPNGIASDLAGNVYAVGRSTSSDDANVMVRRRLVP